MVAVACQCHPAAGTRANQPLQTRGGHLLHLTGVGWCHREQDKTFKAAHSRGSAQKGKRARN